MKCGLVGMVGEERMGPFKTVAWTYPLPRVTEAAIGELPFSTGAHLDALR